MLDMWRTGLDRPLFISIPGVVGALVLVGVSVAPGVVEPLMLLASTGLGGVETAAS